MRCGWRCCTGPASMMPSEPVPSFADGEPHRTSPRTLTLSAISAGLGIAGFLFFAALPEPSTSATSSTSDSPVVLLLFLGILVVRSLAEPVVWWSKTYRVGERSLRLDHGVLSRHRQEIPYDRIQQVDVQQPLVAQILQVALLRVDTAGEAGHSSVALRFLHRSDAEALRVHLLRRRDEARSAAATGTPPSVVVPGAPPPPPPPWSPAGAPPPPPPPWSPAGAPPGPAWASGAPAGTPGFGPVPEVPVLRVGPGRLVAAALTEEVVLAAAVVGVVVLGWGAAAAVSGSAGVEVILGTSLVILFLAGFLLVAASVGSVVRLWDFRLGVRGDDLHLRHGLFDVRELTVPRRRIQHVTMVDNPLRRALGFTTVRLRSAAPPGSAAGAVTTLQLPYVARAELPLLLDVLSGGRGWEVPPLDPRPVRARGRAVRRRCLGLALLVVWPALATWPGGVVLLAVVALGVPWGLLAHRRAGSATTERVVVVAHGALRHRIDVVPLDRVQSARTTSSPFQRRAGLMTVHVDVAAASLVSLLPGARSGAPHLYDIDAAVGARLRGELPRASAPG